MPQLKNAEKALRQSIKRRTRNLAVSNNIAYLIKMAKQQATSKDAKAQETVKNTIRALDKAAQKGILKLNTASRQKSRFLKAIKGLQATAK